MDGIDLGEVTLEGHRLMFWDFAGQEVYCYTHQLFLSDNAIFLVMFQLTTAEEDTNGKLTYWIDSILQRAPNSSCVLIGTCTCYFTEIDFKCEGHLNHLKGQYGDRVSTKCVFNVFLHFN